MTEANEILSRVETKIDTRLNEVVTAHNGVAREVIAMRERLEKYEAKASLPRAGGSGTSYSAEDNEHKSVFIEWMRKPSDPRREGRLSEAQHELSKKDVSIGNNAAGGYGLPKEISTQIEDRVRQLNPFRTNMVDTVQCGSNDFHSLISMGDGTAGWSSETGTRSATVSPTLRDCAPTFGELYALPTASNWSLADIFYDVAAWLVADVAAEFASMEATAIISGSGSSQLTGLLHTTPVTTSDVASPMRAQDALQYIGLTGPGSPLALTFDSFIDLISQVRERYLTEADRCAWVMHRTTLARLRKLKASTAGTYLWEPDSQVVAPPMLLGYPVRTCDAMPQVAAGNFPVIFGNFRRGYLLADRVGMHVIVNPYSVPGVTSFYISARRGGRIKNGDALKVLKIA